MKPLLQRLAQFTLIATLGLGLSACSTPVYKDYNPQTDFSRFQNISYLPKSQDPMAEIANFKNRHPLLAQRVKAAIGKSLSEKGIGLDKDPANGYVSFHIETNSYMTQDPVTLNLGFGTFGRTGGILIGSSAPVVEEKQDTLFIDIYDPSYQVVWRGKSDISFDPDNSPQESQQYIQDVVNRILENFPPKK